MNENCHKELVGLKDKDVAKMLGMSVNTIRRWRYEGQGPKFHKLGRSVRYQITELKQYLKDNEASMTA